MKAGIRRGAASVSLLCLFIQTGLAMDIVKKGKPVATIVIKDGELPKVNFARLRDLNDGVAAAVLVDWVQKMTDAELGVASEAAPGQAAIYIGASAIKAGLKLDDIKDAHGEGLRIVVERSRVLIGGQDPRSTVKAVCRFLEELGCRYYVDSSYLERNGASPFKEVGDEFGKVYPRTENLSIKPTTITEKPVWGARHAWGSSWYWSNLWKVWNGNSLDKMAVSHAWGRYISAKEYYDKHPEYFSLIDGERKSGEWLCTSNKEVREIFVEKLLEMCAENMEAKPPRPLNFSLSPPDNHEHCQCKKCEALDDSRHIVPSSKSVSMTERYLDFFNHIAERVAKKCPDVQLNFYAYADYTEPPLADRREKMHPSLVVWLAPIRYSRYHHIGNPNSPSRMALKEHVDAWSEIAQKMGYRTYNFNLAESTVPFSKMLTWKHDFPYLADRGCVGCNMETFAAWSIMSPHMWLSLRMMYNPYMDVDAAMDDYFTKFYGKKAGPLMEDYWMSIDQAFQDMKAETGCYYSLHHVYTPEMLQKLRGLLDKADKVTKKDPMYKLRVAFAEKGFQMGEDYMGYLGSLNRGDFAKAEAYTERMDERQKADQFAFNNKTNEYIRRFLKQGPQHARRFTTPPNRLHQMLPDQWRMTYDPEDQGEQQGYYKLDFDDTAWQVVKTYTATLNQQGVEEQFTWMWYRTTFQVPKEHGNVILLPLDLDANLYPGHSKVFVNGKEAKIRPNRVGKNKDGTVTESYKNRRPIIVEINSLIVPGKNALAMKLDHHDITENFLGGIVRPVLVCEDNPVPEAEK